MRYRFIICLMVLAAATVGQKARACALPPSLMSAAPEVFLAGIGQQPEPYLAAIDAYAAAMEACYDGPLGPLELTPIVKAADRLQAHLAESRALAEDKVRGNEFDYEALLSSDLWRDLEAVRVAAAYAAAWGQLATAVRQVAAEDKKQALLAAQKSLTRLGFEFKHPVLVQRSMYGLATAQIEAGQLSAAKATLQRLQASLTRGGSKDFQNAVSSFLARISAPDYRPPMALFAAADKSEGADTKFSVGQKGDDIGALKLARQALREARPAGEIAAMLEPAMSASADSARAALALAARDQTIIEAMDYPPGPSLRVMRRAFAAQKHTQMIATWPALQPYYRLMPPAMKRQMDYQIGVAYLNSGALEKAVLHLEAAQNGLNKGPEKTRLSRLIILARLSADEAPDAERLALAKRHIQPSRPAAMADNAVATPEETLTGLIDLRARIVLARHASAQKDWTAADKWLTGIGPDEPAYQLFLGMRVRLLAEGVKGRKAAGAEPKALRQTARGAHILYRLWRRSDCPPGCPTGNRLAVHRAAIEIAISGGLDSTAFGYGWGGFVEEGGDMLPLVGRALDFLVRSADTQRLINLLEEADETVAAQILAQWKENLAKARKSGLLVERYGWLANGMDDLQGRPKAVLLEALIALDLARNRPDSALIHAEALAANFPRRPSAWFMRAAALQANQRHLEAARALSALARRTPATDPVGMGARLGMAALFIDLERGTQACAMRAKIYSRPQAADNWRQAVKAFPILKDWGAATRNCPAS